MVGLYQVGGGLVEKMVDCRLDGAGKGERESNCCAGKFGRWVGGENGRFLVGWGW